MHMTDSRSYNAKVHKTPSDIDHTGLSDTIQGGGDRHDIPTELVYLGEY